MGSAGFGAKRTARRGDCARSPDWRRHLASRNGRTERVACAATGLAGKRRAGDQRSDCGEHAGAGESQDEREDQSWRRICSGGVGNGCLETNVFPMSNKALFAQRRDGRVAALQYLFAWSMNTPKNLTEDLRVFFENMEHPRTHFAFGEELIHGVIANVADIDSRIKGLAHNWEFERIAKIDLA